MPLIISHSVNHEDVLLARAFSGQEAGFYIDIGAHHPIDHSLTKLLSDRGWCGVNVEPNPELIRAFDRDRPRDVNLLAAAAARTGKSELFVVRGHPQLSTLSAAAAEQYRASGYSVETCAIDTLSLADLCDRYARGREVDVLLIDAEGAESEILSGADFSLCAPRVLLIEATLPMTNTPVHEVWDHYIPKSLYNFTLFDGINRIYVRRDEVALNALLSYPVNCLDCYTSRAQHEMHAVVGRYYSLSRPMRWAAHSIQSAIDVVKNLGSQRRSDESNR